MNRSFMSGVGVVLAAALVLAACGGTSPTSPSGRGVVLQGTVLSGTGASDVSAHSGPSSSLGRIVVTVQEAPGVSTTVSSNGTFELEGLPTGTITLVFTADGKTIGTLTLSGVGAEAEVKIVVQLTGDGVVLIEIKIEGHDQQGPPGPADTCLISGGRAGENIELEGTVDSGSTTLFKMNTQGNRARGLVDVNSSGASWRCVGQSGADCKATFKAGNKVHVRGTLTTCTTSQAIVTATEVKVQKP